MGEKKIDLAGRDVSPVICRTKYYTITFLGKIYTSTFCRKHAVTKSCVKTQKIQMSRLISADPQISCTHEYSLRRQSGFSEIIFFPDWTANKND